MTDFDEIHDPGLQQERTILAWDRTGLALMVASGLLARSVGPRLDTPAGVVAGLVFLFGLGLVVTNRSRYLGRRRRLERGAGMVTMAPMSLLALVTVALGVAGFLVVLGVFA